MVKHEFTQGSPDWMAFRAGKIRGTNAAALLKADQKNTAFYTLMAEMDTGKIEDGATTFAMSRGVEREIQARIQYELEYGISMEEVGFITSVRNPFLGFSPDGVQGNVVFEFKCGNAGTHLKYTQKPDAFFLDYRGQIRHPFVVSDQIEKVVCISWNPDSHRPFWVEERHRSDFDTDEISLIRNELITNYRLVQREFEKFKQNKINL